MKAGGGRFLYGEEMGNGKWEGSGVGRRAGLYDIFFKEGKGSRSFSRCYTLRGVEGEQIELAVHERY